MFYRGRRLRKNHVIRGLMREHALSAQDLIYPLFLMEGLSGKQELKLAVKNGLMKEEVIYETLLSLKRAGADLIITYFALEIAKKL